MALLDLFRPTHEAFPVANRDAIMARYNRLRAARLKLNNKLVERLTKDDLHEGARRLGMLQGDILVFNTEDETSVLMDYCLYDVRRNGRNTIEQYLIDTPPDPESDEMACLRAMQHSTYSMFVIDAVKPGLGAIVEDLLTREVLLLTDMGLGSTAVPGSVFVSRLLRHDGFSMTSGAALPVGIIPADERDAASKTLARAMIYENDGSFDPAPLIRECLSHGSSTHVQYQDPSGEPSGGFARQREIPYVRPSALAGRNAPCPCGSGKKFKQCCLKPR